MRNEKYFQEKFQSMYTYLMRKNIKLLLETTVIITINKNCANRLKEDVKVEIEIGYTEYHILFLEIFIDYRRLKENIGQYHLLNEQCEHL